MTSNKDMASGEAASSPEAVLQYLRHAPPEAAAWAAEQIALLSAPAAQPAPVDDESDDFYSGLDENDDDLLSPKTAGAGSPATTPRQWFTGSTRIFLLAALIGGIAFGIWFAGRPAEEPAAQTPAMDSQLTGEEASNRIADLQLQVEKDPSDIKARLELGVLLFNEKNMDQAKEQWLAVTELDPTELNAWYNLGFFYLSQTPSDVDSAKAAWQQLIDIDPQSDMAKTVSMHLQGLEETPQSNAGE